MGIYLVALSSTMSHEATMMTQLGVPSTRSCLLTSDPLPPSLMVLIRVLLEYIVEPVGWLEESQLVIPFEDYWSHQALMSMLILLKTRRIGLNLQLMCVFYWSLA